MSPDRILNSILLEQELLTRTMSLLKENQSLNRSCVTMIRENNHNLNTICTQVVANQRRLIDNFVEDRQSIEEKLKGVVDNVLHNEEKLIDQLKRLEMKLTRQTRRRPLIRVTSQQIRKVIINQLVQQTLPKSRSQSMVDVSNPSKDEILKVYWRSWSFINSETSPLFSPIDQLRLEQFSRRCDDLRLI